MDHLSLYFFFVDLYTFLSVLCCVSLFSFGSQHPFQPRTLLMSTTISEHELLRPLARCVAVSNQFISSGGSSVFKSYLEFNPLTSELNPSAQRFCFLNREFR
jgi:hypothetical protein